jgi:spore germination cell wall hydrolase CwlJ-like protein
MTHALTQKPAQLWRDYPRETLVLGLLGFVASAAFAGASYNVPPSTESAIADSVAKAAPPAPPPLLVRELAPEDALQVNQTIPLINGPNPAAAPFRLAAASAAAKERAIECLTSAVYYEAGSEDVDGQRAVAQVVLNRVRHAAFPANVCGVVFQGSTRATGCQFTFTCDGSLARRPSEAGWARARKIAEAALAGAVYEPVGYATHYHANYVVPYWASSLAKNAVVGAHIFYRWAGGWGRPASFSKRYAGVEPDVRALRGAALAAEAATAAQAAAAGSSEAERLKIKEAHDLEVMNAIFATGKAPEKRLAVRFNPAARKAVEEATHREYVDKFEASDNLRWSLSGDAVKENETPLGKAKPAATAAGAATGASAP